MGSHNHSRSRTKRKAWKDHFFQFLMIFLAVTLGFFAENLRENYMENVRIRQYAQSLYDDLKIDTAIIQRTFDEKEWIRAKFDSAEIILASDDLTNNNEFIYYIERYLGTNDVFTSQDVTYQQLRSSGNFRYMKNISLYKNIADYYNLYARYQFVDGAFGFTDVAEYSEIEAKLFNVKHLTSLNNEYATSFYDVINYPENKLEPIKMDKEYITLLHIKIANAKARSFTSKAFLSWLKRDATKLINQLKEEYNLE